MVQNKNLKKKLKQKIIKVNLNKNSQRKKFKNFLQIFYLKKLQRNLKYIIFLLQKKKFKNQKKMLKKMKLNENLNNINKFIKI